MIPWEQLTRDDIGRITRIVDRAMELAPEHYVPIEREAAEMDIVALHLKTPLRLDDLYAADLDDFCADVFGIMEHLDRESGELQDGFVPKFRLEAI